MIDHKVSRQLLVYNIATFINRLRTDPTRSAYLGIYELCIYIYTQEVRHKACEIPYIYMHTYYLPGDESIISYQLFCVSCIYLSLKIGRNNKLF